MADVWSSASENTYQSVTVNNDNSDVSTEAVHTRIYKYSDPTIQLDEMSVPLLSDGGISPGSMIDPSTGMHENSKDVANINSNSLNTTGTNAHSSEMTIGSLYPLIRINDRYFNHKDIKYFSLETAGFLPTITLELLSVSNEMQKHEQIKDGDKVSVFINSGHGMIKSYRGDFIITSVVTGKTSTVERKQTTKIFIQGELYIPNLYNNLTFSYIGTSRDALMDAAEKLGLGFFFCDPDNTEDTQVWYCTSDGSQKNTKIPPIQKYIQNVANHSYKNFNSFYDCWVDPRYGLTFVNINKMLGESGLDEPIDIAFFNNANTISKGMAGQNSELTDEQKKNNPRPQAKILTNFGSDPDSITAFFIKNFEEVNAGADLTSQLGLNTTTYYDIQNSGLSPDEVAIEMKYSMPLNHDKLHNGFYALLGPGQNLYYKEGDNGSYVDQHTTTQGGKLADLQADSDAEEMLNSKSNMRASGNINKFYEVGYNHNLLNNTQLKKKQLNLTLNGCNLQIMRGEKIPTLIYDNKDGANLIGITANTAISQKVYESYSGWFIISRIRWNYIGTATPTLGTHWETELTLTRREWPIPGYIKQDMDHSQIVIQTENNPETGSVKESNNSADISTNIEKTDKQEITSQGLSNDLIKIYNDIKQSALDQNKSIKLIAGRRWAADEAGNRIDGEPIIQDGNTWKFVNANGDILWYSSKTSPHLYGNAIDIINDKGTDFNNILNIIVNSQQTLYDLLESGVYVGIETSKDDSGNTVKHWHIGKPDSQNDIQINGQRIWWEQVQKMINKNVIEYNGKSLNISQYLQYNK